MVLSLMTMINADIYSLTLSRTACIYLSCKLPPKPGSHSILQFFSQPGIFTFSFLLDTLYNIQNRNTKYSGHSLASLQHLFEDLASAAKKNNFSAALNSPFRARIKS
jgi:hypothetical protein